MSSPRNTLLATYLHDHLAGANLAIELLEKWRTGSEDKDLRSFADELLFEIKHDRTQLRRVIRTVGSAGHSLKEAAGWLAEKATRLKLETEGDTGLALFEGLELLMLGIAGKSALWQMLAVLARSNQRLRRFDFRGLVRRADAQCLRVGKRRLAAGAVAFTIETQAEAELRSHA